MITYTYKCDDCEVVFKTQQSIKDDAHSICPECNSDTLHRVIQPPLMVMMKGEPKTLGALAEQNTKYMSQEQIRQKQEEYRTKVEISRTPSSLMPESKPDEPVPEIPAEIRKEMTKSSKDILKMTPQQQEKYIHTGE